jgi:excisionase family DNA binding protein
MTRTNGSSPAPVKGRPKLPWLSIDEAAVISQYHPEYIRKLCRKGRIKAEKKSNRDWWIDKAALEEYLSNPPPPGRPKGKGTAQNEAG